MSNTEQYDLQNDAITRDEVNKIIDNLKEYVDTVANNLKDYVDKVSVKKSNILASIPGFSTANAIYNKMYREINPVPDPRVVTEKSNKGGNKTQSLKKRGRKTKKTHTRN